MKADKASVQDEDAGQEHDDQQASQLLEGVKSPKEDVAAVTLSPMQHEQVLGLFRPSYRIVMAARTHIDIALIVSGSFPRPGLCPTNLTRPNGRGDAFTPIR